MGVFFLVQDGFFRCRRVASPNKSPELKPDCEKCRSYGKTKEQLSHNSLNWIKASVRFSSHKPRRRYSTFDTNFAELDSHNSRRAILRFVSLPKPIKDSHAGSGECLVSRENHQFWSETPTLIDVIPSAASNAEIGIGVAGAAIEVKTLKAGCH